MYRALLTGVLTVSTILATVFTAQAQTGRVLSDQILPKQTFLYVSFPSVTTLKNHFAESSIGQMWNDPALDAFKAEVDNAFSSELNEGLVQVEEVLDLPCRSFCRFQAAKFQWLYPRRKATRWVR